VNAIGNPRKINIKNKHSIERATIGSLIVSYLEIYYA
tara:strand:- start:450 stop:560 length:111 start_codon:yes stop_codon:yes gene_type:complete